MLLPYLFTPFLILQLCTYVTILADWKTFLVPNAARCIVNLSPQDCNWGAWPTIFRLLAVLLPLLLFLRGAGPLPEEKAKAC